MNNKLTAQIAALYPNSWIKHITLGKVKMLGVNFEGKTIRILTDSGNPLWLEDYNCKLILTQLENISDEHAIEVAFCRRHKDTPECEALKVKSMRNCKIIDYRWIDTIPELNGHDGYSYSSANVYFDMDNMHVKQIDILRGYGYDCGYGSIPSLIQAGIAIDSTTL